MTVMMVQQSSVTTLTASAAQTESAHFFGGNHPGRWASRRSQLIIKDSQSPTITDASDS